MTGVRLTVALVILGLAAGIAGADETDAPVRPSEGSGGPAGTFENERIEVEGLQRVYRLVVPKSLDLSVPVPLVFAFHGFLVDSKENIARYSRLEQLAADEGFVAVFPGARDRRWRVGTQNNPDIAFFDALYEHLTAAYNIDRNRVYVTGMSNGAYFSNLLAAKRSEVIAAAAPHSGGMAMLLLTGVGAARKYPVMIIHGTRDVIVPVSEGHRSRDLYNKEGHPVEYVELADLGHYWGTRSDVSRKMWEFFRKHPLRETEE